MIHTKISSALVLLMTLSTIVACTDQNQMGTKQTFGTLGGAVGGGLLGSQVGSGKGRLVAVGVGTLLGALVGSEIGKSMDETDRQASYNAMNRATAAPINQSINWNNPDSGNYGSYTPIRDGYQEGTGAYCREFQQTISVSGRTQRGYGTACRQPDGTWRIVE